MDQNLSTPPDKLRYPRTRAWAKREKDKTANIIPDQEIAPSPQHRKEPSKAGSSQNSSTQLKRNRPLRRSSRLRETSSLIVSQGTGAKQPKQSRRQVERVAAKRVQQRRGTAQGQVSRRRFSRVAYQSISKLTSSGFQVGRLAQTRSTHRPRRCTSNRDAVHSTSTWCRVRITRKHGV